MQAKAATAKQESRTCEKTSKISRIPLKIDDELIVRSLTNFAHRAKCKIIGAIHGEFILINEPVVMINDRLSTTIEDEFVCSYFSEGYLYNFRSRYRRHVIDDVVSIDYPGHIESKQIRRHRRIKVNIETEFSIAGTADITLGDMLDISQGGCRVILHSLVSLAKGMSGSLTFSLPNEDAVGGLIGTIMSVKYVRSRQTTELGICFCGPKSELAKVTNFCEFCMFFDAE